MTVVPELSRRRLLGSGTALLAAGAIGGTTLAASRTAFARSTPPVLVPEQITQVVHDAHRRHASVMDGKNADYIPYLASVPSNLFGVAVALPDGTVIEAGDTGYAFAIESIAKVFTLGLVLKESGADVVQQKLGADATGFPFNSVMAMELNGGKPVNPLVNAGAMATVSLVQAASPEERWSKISGNMNAFAGRDLPLNEEVYKSEADTNQHNRGIAMLLKSYGYMYSDPLEACDIYTRECSIGITTRDLAVMGGTLASGGVNPVTHATVIPADLVPKLLAEMAAEGLYERTGDWMYTVGVPAKSGVGGGIVAVVPGTLAIAAFSPPLDAAGNSVRAQLAIRQIATQLALNIFAG